MIDDRHPCLWRSCPTLLEGDALVCRFHTAEAEHARCACGGYVLAERDEEIAAAVEEHNATAEHQDWRERNAEWNLRGDFPSGRQRAEKAGV